MDQISDMGDYPVLHASREWEAVGAGVDSMRFQVTVIPKYRDVTLPFGGTFPLSDIQQGRTRGYFARAFGASKI